MTDLIKALMGVYENEEQPAELREQAKKVADDLIHITTTLLELGFPAEELEVSTEDLGENGMDIFFSLGGYEIPEGMNYEQFKAYVSNLQDGQRTS